MNMNSPQPPLLPGAIKVKKQGGGELRAPIYGSTGICVYLVPYMSLNFVRPRSCASALWSLIGRRVIFKTLTMHIIMEIIAHIRQQSR